MIVSPLADVFGTEWYHNSLQAWLTAALTAVGGFVALVLIRRVVVSRLGALAARTTTNIDDMLVDIVAETRKWVLGTMSIYFALLPLTLPKIEPYLHPTAKLVLLW